MKVAVSTVKKWRCPRSRSARVSSDMRELHREAVLVPDVSKDPRYIKVLEDVRSELAIPMLLKDRCIGVFDLESPELDAFTKRDVGILTMLASQAAVAIENARLYEELSANEARLEKELGFAKRVQAALLPTQLPKRLKGVTGGAVRAARELGARFPRLSDARVPHAGRRAGRRVW
jgi:GAF domain-containing protein